MFIVSLTYKKDLTEVDKHISAHIAYLEKYYALGCFIVSGRKVPRTGGIILANVSGKPELEAILQQDPFNIAGVANYDITEFIPTMTNQNFQGFKYLI